MTQLIAIAYIFFLLLLLILLVSLTIAAVSLAPWVPSRNKDLEKIFSLANLKPGEVFYDLGCGTGKLVFYANKYYKAKAMGIELALPLFLICELRELFRRDKNLVFKHKNLFKENLSQADVVYVFGLPGPLSKKLKPKLEKELKSGARVISYAFEIEGLKPKIISKPSPKGIPIYLYTF